MAKNNKDFQLTIDGRDWDYRDPRNQQMIERHDPDSRYSGNSNRGRPKSNPHSYSSTNPLYDYSYGQVRDAAKSLNINNVNSSKEVESIVDRIQNPVTSAAPKQKVKKSQKNQNAKLAAPSETPKVSLSRPAAEANAFVDSYNDMMISGKASPLQGFAVSNQAGVSSPEAGSFKQKYQLSLGSGNLNFASASVASEGSTGTSPSMAGDFMSKYSANIKKHLEPR